MNSIDRINITIIHILFGKIPDWFYFFLQSCKYNPEIQFLIFTDNQKLTYSIENVKIIKITKDEFSRLIYKTTSIKVNFSDPNKICDFRPAFGLIFKNYLISSDYWGYCDNDIIFGNLSHFQLHSLIKDNDIISMYNTHLSGPFCIFRNEEKICNLFRKASEYIETLTLPIHLAFDENIIRPAYKGITVKKIVIFLKFLWNTFTKKSFKIQSFKQIIFNFQWFYKKERLKNKQPIDMTEVIWKNSDEIRVYFNHLLDSDRHYKRSKIKNWKLKWENGHLINLSNGKEIFAFHFIESKNTNNFQVKAKPDNSNFFVEPKGIF